MITTKQLKIFQVFVKNPFETYTLQQIKKLAKEKSNNALSIAMKQFRKENLLIEQKVGRSSLYTLNWTNNRVYYYVALSNYLRLNGLLKRTVSRIEKNIEIHTKFYSLVIFGSYATSEHKKDSDLDIAIFVETEKLRKNIQKAIDAIELKSIIKIDSHIITQNEFLEMLNKDEENLGKQIARKHLAVHNHQIFYTLILTGMKNGFRI